MEMHLTSTMITEGSIELTYADSNYPESAARLISIRMPIETDGQRMLLTLRQEALLKAQAVLAAEISASAHILDPSLRDAHAP